MKRLRTRPATRLRIVARALVVLLILVSVSAFVLWRLTHVPPTWYDPPADTQKTRDLADRTEYRLVEEAQKIRPPDEQWTVRIREHQLNAWLATRLPQWIDRNVDNDWPDQLGTPQVRLTDAGIDVAIELITQHNGDAHSEHRFIIARLQPEVRRDQLSIRVTRVGAGRLLLPGDPARHVDNVIDRLNRDDQLSAEVAAFVNDLTGDGRQLDRDIDLADDRFVRIVAVQLRRGFMDVTLRTRPERERRRDGQHTDTGQR